MHSKNKKNKEEKKKAANLQEWRTELDLMFVKRTGEETREENLGREEKKAGNGASYCDARLHSGPIRVFHSVISLYQRPVC